MHRRAPAGALTLTFCALTAVGLLLQLVFPSLLHVFERNAAEIQHGQWWRLATSLFFQDGGLPAGLANIAALLFVGSLAEQLFAPAEWLAIYWSGALSAGLVALSWQPVGAGNSIAICSLGGALVAGWPAERGGWRSTVWRALAAVAGGFLLARRDIHGMAFLTGGVLYLALGRRSPFYMSQ